MAWNYAFTNWKTSLGGVLVIALSVLGLFGVSVPGFNIDIGAAIPLGLSLIFAKDGDGSGAVKQ